VIFKIILPDNFINSR